MRKRAKLSSISIKGFKSIYNMPKLELKDINILIGANGAGKSNFLFFFKMLSDMINSGQLQFIIGKYGGADDFLFDGSATTPLLEAHLVFNTATGDDEYLFKLSYAMPDTLIFAEEKYLYIPKGVKDALEWTNLGTGGYKEAEIVNKKNLTTDIISNILRDCRVFQFHNTSETARLRKTSGIADNLYLREDAANISAYLYRIKKNEIWHYNKIRNTLRLIIPFFDDFVLEPENDVDLIIKYKEIGAEKVFGSHLLSDGSLRTIALVTLLLQPEDKIPSVLVIDEPELGLHPYAINIIAGLIKSVSRHSQVIIATQSTYFLDCFNPDDVIVVERNANKSLEPRFPERASVFRRLKKEDLEVWLDEDYSLSALWEKNVLGGRPK